MLEGNRNESVRIIDLRPVAHCTAPLNGTAFFSPSAGADNTVAIGFDLDKPRPAPQRVEGYDWKGDYFDNQTISLKPEEQQTFQITARTEKHYCEYSLEFTILEEGRVVTQTVDDNGRPFQVTAWVRKNIVGPGSFSDYQALYVYDLRDGSWGREDPATY